MEVDQAKLPVRESVEGHKFVSDEILDAADEPLGRGALPWYAILRIPLGQLFLIGSLFLSVAGVYATSHNNSQEVERIKETAESKESAQAESKLIIQKLEAMEKQREQDRSDFLDRLDRIEDRLDERFETTRKGRR